MKVIFYAETNKLRTRMEVVVDIDDEEWNEMSDAEKQEYGMEQLVSAGLDIGWEL